MRDDTAFTRDELDTLDRARAMVVIHPPARTNAPSLSRRERQVLDLVADGLTNAEIAEVLGLSPLTVKKHLERVYARLGVANRAAAVAAMTQQTT